MKIRNSLVSNSSASSFIAIMKEKFNPDEWKMETVDINDTELDLSKEINYI